jgi:hypothetical protein
MQRIIAVALACMCAVAPLQAQRPDSATADSLAKARADSIALVQELERMSPDTAARRVMGPQPAPINPRLMPDISAIGDFIGDLSPDGSTQEDGSRVGVREVEIAIAANVDPYFRADFILGLSDLEGIAIEEAYGTALALPAQLQARIGRYHMPFGKQNTTHRAELHSIEYPYVIQRFLGEEGLKGTGIWVSRIFAPFGFYQELQLSANDRLGEAPEDLVVEEAPNKDLGGLTYSARLRNYWDFSESANLEWSASALTAQREQPFDFGAAPPAPDVNAINAREFLYGTDITFRWRPLQQGLYKSFIGQVEVMHHANERVSDASYLGPNRDFTGAYAFGRYQLTRRLHLGGRYDWVEDPELGGETLTAASGYLEWFPSEFSKMVAAFERRMPASVTGIGATNRILLQATFAVGPHRPHPF